MARPKGSKDKKPRKNRYSPEDRGEGDGASTKAISPAYYFGRLKPPVTDDEIIERIYHFFEWCQDHDVRLGMACFYLALGVTKRTFYMRLNGEVANSYSSRIRDSLLLSKQIIAAYFEQLMLNADIHPTIASFIGVNNFGYVATTTLKIETVEKPRQLLNADAVRDKYKSSLTTLFEGRVIEGEYEDVVSEEVLQE